jgi:GxxExxY protein
VYEPALVEELNQRGVTAHQQVGIDVRYKGTIVGQYIADLWVGGAVLVELKAEKELNPGHQAQLLNYIKATGTRVGLLLNFGQAKCEWKRLML